MSVRLNDMTDETIIRSIGIDNNSMEKTLHGRSDFPVAVYNTTLSNFHLGYVDWHWHKELQFCYVTSGKVDFSVGAEHHVLNEGEGIFINSGHIHTARPADSPDDSFVCLDFDPKLLSVFAGSVFESNYVRPYIGSFAFSAQELRPDIQWQKSILDRLLHIANLYQSETDYYEYEVMKELITVWTLLLSNISAEITFGGGTTKNKLIKEIIDYIQQNYADEIRLDDISNAVSYSTGECCRAFRAGTGKTIFGYIKEYRVKRSMDLLVNTGLSVSDIAYSTGFSSTSYFIKCFKEISGTTPLRYRSETKNL